MNDWIKRLLKILPVHIAVVIMIIVGCAGSPMAITLKSAEELKTVPDMQLCAAYAWGHSKTVQSELKRREIFNESEWRAIEAKSVYVGMSKKAMLAARPNLMLTGISKIGEYGLVEIYKEMFISVDAYIYVKDDKVVGYQMW